MPRFTRTNTPLFEPVVALIAGIVLTEQLAMAGFAQGWIWTGIAVIVCGIGWSVIRKSKRSLLWSLFLMVGIGLTIWHRIDIEQTTAGAYPGERLTFLGQIDSNPQQRGRWIRSETSLFCFAEDDSLGKMTEDWIPALSGRNEKIWLYVDTAAFANRKSPLQIGDIVQFRGRIYPALEGDSTGYSLYMLRTRDMTGRCFAWSAGVVGSDSSTFSTRVNAFRQRLSDRLALLEEGDDPSAAGIMQALAIGNQQTIDRELRDSYSRTGMAHLLSVSGLHVGIVFLILNFLLGWIRLFRDGNIALGILVIGLLCGYAVLTGLAPSVLRAVLMFSLLQVGLMLSRYTNNFNTLCAAALFLLLCDPYYIYHIGFQLSFAAMVGIIVLYQPIARLWRPRWMVLRWFWGLTVVTLAAQIGVFPLVMYHFGQIQLAGILLNPFVWFTVPFIIGGSLLYLGSGWGWVLEITHTVTGWQNELIRWMASHPWIALEDIHISAWMCAAMYAVIIGGMIWINRRLGQIGKGTKSYFLRSVDASSTRVD